MRLTMKPEEELSLALLRFGAKKTEVEQREFAYQMFRQWTLTAPVSLGANAQITKE